MKIHFLLFTLIATVSGTGTRFCVNQYYPVGSCPSNHASICSANSDHCIKAGVQMIVKDVGGCEEFADGTRSGNCDDLTGCNPTERTYCECKECNSDTDCENAFLGGLGTTCQSASTNSVTQADEDVCPTSLDKCNATGLQKIKSLYNSHPDKPC